MKDIYFSKGDVLIHRAPYENEPTYTIERVDLKGGCYIMACGFHLRFEEAAFYEEEAR